MDEHRAWGWKIVNHGKYRAIKNEDDRREQNKLAQARWREKNKTSSSKQPSAGVSDSKQPSAGVSEVSPSRGRGRGRGSKQMQQAEAEGSAPALPTQKQLCPKVERKLLGEDWLQNGMATESTSPLPYDVIAAKVCSFFNRPAGAAFLHRAKCDLWNFPEGKRAVRVEGNHRLAREGKGVFLPVNVQAAQQLG